MKIINIKYILAEISNSFERPFEEKQRGNILLMNILYHILGYNASLRSIVNMQSKN